MFAPWRGSAPRSSRRLHPRNPAAVKNHRLHAVRNWQRKAARTMCLTPALLRICSSTSGILARQSTTAWAWCPLAICRSVHGSRSQVCGYRPGRVQPCGSSRARTAQSWPRPRTPWLQHLAVQMKPQSRLLSAVTASVVLCQACSVDAQSVSVEVHA